jgi:hypothetical protein
MKGISDGAARVSKRTLNVSLLSYGSNVKYCDNSFFKDGCGNRCIQSPLADARGSAEPQRRRLISIDITTCDWAP